MKLKQNIDIILLLVLGFVLRFSVSIIHSYSNDELSAITRLKYTNFSDLIEFGVQKGDMHPAGVQVFMKLWGGLFGQSEMAMRFPFVIFGTLSILVLFLIGKEWFNRKAGLFAAGLLTVLYFPILNSEFARPYSPGLLIALLVGLLFYRVLFTTKKQLLNAILLGVSFAAGMYTHYFAFLFVAFIGATGLLFLTKQNYRYYLLAGGLGVALFLPHINVTLYHLGVGGLQWLAPPDGDWLFQFLYHAFNESTLIIIALLATGAVAYTFFRSSELTFQKRAVLIAALWFFGIYLVGHILSFISTPVLKFPVMLFAFPYLLLLIGLLFSYLPKIKIILPVLLGMMLMSTIVEKSLYQNVHFALFKEPGIKIADWQTKYGEENIYTIYNLNNPDYMNFYANEWGGDSIQFDWSELEFATDIPLREDLLKATEEYCVIGFSSRITLVQIYETVKEFYPTVVAYERYNNGAVFLMTRGNDPSANYNKKEFARFDSKASDNNWVYDPAFTVAGNGSQYKLDDKNIYGPDYRFTLNDIPSPYANYYLKVNVSAALKQGDELTVAFTADRGGSQLTHHGEPVWVGHDLERMITTSATSSGYFAFKIPYFIKSSDLMKISLWNRGGTPITIDHFSISIVKNIWN